MRKTIAAAVVMSLVAGSGSAFAQSVQPNKLVNPPVQQCARPEWVTPSFWQGMSAEERFNICHVDVKVPDGSATYKYVETSQSYRAMFSPGLATAGVIAAGVGLGMMLATPTGTTRYDGYYGSPTCYSGGNAYGYGSTSTDGACGSKMPGALIMAAGAVGAVFGFRIVTKTVTTSVRQSGKTAQVSPVVTPKMQGVTAQVTW